jgi:recombination protein RecT
MNTAVVAKPAERALTPYEKFRGKLEALRPEIAALVGKDTVDRFVRVCLNAVQATPKLLDADRRTLLLACVKAAQDGLMPDGREAVFNIYKTKIKGDGGRDEWIEAVQYLPMVHGLVKKLYDSEQVTFVDAVAVYEKDSFFYQRGDEPKIQHSPYAGDEDPGKVVAAYVVAKLKNGETKREVMFRRDIEKVRDASKAKDGPGWTTWYDQFAIKSVIKRAYKQLPSTPEIDGVIASDNEALGISFGPSDQGIDLAEPPQRGAAGLKQALAGKPKGTPEQRDKFIAGFGQCKDAEVLALARDEANMHDWTDADRDALDSAYSKRQSELEAT